MFQLLVVVLVGLGLFVSGCQAWPLKRQAGEAGVDTELMTQPPVQPTASVIPQEPQPGFKQEPKQAP